MSQARHIEHLLRRVRAGDRASFSSLLAKLSGATLFVPVSKVIDLSDTKGTNRVRVATFAKGSKRMLPGFTDKEVFSEWSAGRYYCFPVIGADLALSLPRGTSLIINPGQTHFVELDQEQVLSLSGERSARSTELEKLLPDDFRQHEDAELALAVLDEAISDSEAEWETPFLANRENLAMDLAAILAEFSEVAEAYLHENFDDPEGEVGLGLLCEGLDAERRFLLVDRIGELSRAYFGIAGAIVVFDDLDVKSSSSWDLFKSLQPIYSRGEGVVGEIKERLSSGIEQLAEPVDESRWQNVRRTGSRVWNVIRGGKEH